MENKFVVDNNWSEYQLYVDNEYGFKQIFINNFIRNSAEFLIVNGCKKILDLGCGSGKHSIYLAKRGFEVYASDIDCKSIQENIKNLELPYINIKQHSFTEIPYEKEFFDAVICTSTLHHAIYKDIEMGISEIYRVLKPNGYFIFDILSDEDESYGLGDFIEKGTFIGSRSGEEEVPHHYTNESELMGLSKKFSKIHVNKSIYILKDIEYTSKVFDVLAVK